MAKSESKLDPDPQGHNDGGLACGVVQVHAELWNMDCDELISSPEIGLEFLAKHIKKGDAWKYWTSLNCYTYVNTKFNFKLPHMADIIVNTSIAHKGEVAIFWYRSNVTGKLEKHIALTISDVENGTFTVAEANFKPGVIGTRVIHIDDPHLAGFWDSRAV